MDALNGSQGDIAIAAHISVNQLLLCQILGISPYEARQFRLPCGSYCALSWNGRFSVQSTGRLPNPALTPWLAEKLLLAAEPGQKVIAHSRAVAKEAVRIARVLNLDSQLLESAALLHDVARNHHSHPMVGAAWLRELGYNRAADLIEVHHDYKGDTLDEAAVLYIADKVVKEDRPVSLEERFAGSLARCATAEAKAAHQQRKETALAIKESINGRCGRIIIE